ncbi:DUF998 domain-containing protein [Amycolatopsis cihanbeyliensis]|uniref:Uncharacterized protein DUF998 n=1 Tax=Amycolatopsis cihanbeyliensis TaxID=1128664 RepID=A0A542CSA8_AMYCI|nr:DUF998 domain-containing protein [Amycolatopsis cihanbeyliensis]TQI93709.1 uncharacterized protein DUF998 [Amycolatopsis cihanbeyliensis]
MTYGGGSRAGWRTAQVGGLLALAIGACLLTALHLVPPASEISPIRRTLSEYALGPSKWVFDLALLLVAAASAVAFAEVARRRLSRSATALGVLWTVSLLVLVTFTKTDWSIGPSIGGLIHRYTSVVAFLALPAAVLLLARPVFPASAGKRWLARGLSVFSLLWFGTILAAIGYMMSGGPAWWRFLPLGLIERMLVGSAVAALAVLIVGLIRLRPRDTGPAMSSPPAESRYP